MKEIQLTKGQVALVDDKDFEELNQYSWYAKECPHTYYAKRRVDKHTEIYMHHQIMGRPPEGLMSDHEDSNGLNNQRYNLSIVTNRENSWYKNISTTSVYPGVDWKKERSKWRAQIKINGKTKFLGYFDDEKEAYKVYQKAVDNLEDVSLPDWTMEELMKTIKKIKEKQGKLSEER